MEIIYVDYTYDINITVTCQFCREVIIIGKTETLQIILFTT